MCSNMLSNASSLHYIYQFSCPEPPVPQESISNSSAIPDRSTTFLRTACAAGLRQMLPVAYSEFTHLVDKWWGAGSEIR